MRPRTIPGIHHITAIASDPMGNLEFYTRVLGLRLVKRTVNFDDPGSYHLYFGDAYGTPGSILTFFPWPGIPRGQVGNGQVSAIAFAIPAGSGSYWRARLAERAVIPREGGPRFGEPVVLFSDPDRLPLELIEASRGASSGASGTPVGDIPPAGVPPDYAIIAFHSA